jgi:hypothetical protein
MLVKKAIYFNYLEIIFVSCQYRDMPGCGGAGGNPFRADNSGKAELRSR